MISDVQSLRRFGSQLSAKVSGNRRDIEKSCDLELAMGHY
jgi:hypothetical protein